MITAATPMEEIEHSFPEVEGKKSGKSEGGGGSKPPSMPPPPPPPAAIAEATEEEVEDESKPAEGTSKNKVEREESDDKSLEDLPADSAPFPVSSSSGSEADTASAPSTGDNSQSRGTVVEVESTDEVEPDIIPPQMLIGGRASIPEELQPEQLERLQNLKESNA